MAVEKSVGEKYIEFLRVFTAPQDADLSKEIKTLFTPTAKKVVNLREVSTNWAETLKQMNAVKTEFGIQEIKVHEYLETADKRTGIIRWEITYNDGDVESVITIIKANAQGLIEEINEVFGQKGIYEWPAN
ncbi:MAG: hypothetical protein AB7F19_03745 [Candidatus Babeliales bacterium]